MNDDYVKFIRFGQHFIERNGSGVLAFINPHGFLDNATFRGMRWNLLKTYDKIYTIDLHGNSKKKEVSPDGSADVNVFDIMQGVAITIFVKTAKKKPTELGQVFHYDLFGKRDFKYDFLSNNSLKNIKFQELKPNEPYYFFVPKNNDGRETYEIGFRVDILFNKNVTGIVTMGDEFAFSNTKNEMKLRLNEFINNNLKEVDLKNKYDLGKNYAEFILKSKQLLKIEDDKFVKCSYRPFDDKWTYFDNKILWRWRADVMQHFIKNKNVGLALCKQFKSGDNYLHSFISSKIIESSYVSNRTSEITSTFPLYLYPESNGQLTTDTATPPFGHPSKGEFRVPNLNIEIVNKIANKLNLKFTNEKTIISNSPLEGCPQGGVEFAPIDILDYIYAVLHSPKYREKYKEFLKIDFPKIPYPKNAKTFWELVALGSQIRQIHLLESPKVEEYITEFNIDGNCVVEKAMFVNSPPLEGCPTGGVVIISHEKEIFINKTKIIQNPILVLPFNEALKQRAKELRQAENLSEVLFWMQVTKGGFHKIDFDRQRIIGNYIVDFYVKNLGLIIEIDGSSHDNKQEYDAKRQQYLESLGLRVYKIQVVDVMKQMKTVLKDLENYIVEQYGEKPPRPSGTPQEGNFGNVFINETQNFENVPEVAWNFYIGGYQPAQKWLKDRKGRKLEFDDIAHYQKIIVALSETNRLMKEIDKIEIENN